MAKYLRKMLGHFREISFESITVSTDLVTKIADSYGCYVQRLDWLQIYLLKIQEFEEKHNHIMMGFEEGFNLLN